MSSVDVVVPCYRYGRYLRDCVQSVLTQAACDVRVLVIDDESPDDTPEIGAALAEADTRVSYRRHAVNRGHISTYNEGIDWAQADYMLLLSADDYLLPGAVGRAVAMMDAHPEMGLCFGNAVELQVHGGMRPIRVKAGAASGSFAMSGARFIELSIRAGAQNIVPTPSAFVRTRLLKRLGAYRSDLPHSADLELWLRLAANASVGYIHEDQAVYRRHDANMSLGYAHDNALRDLQQRGAAIEAFVDTCRAQLPDAAATHASLTRSLALDAVGQASQAFNNSRFELSLRACEFAATLHPGIRRTMAWNRLRVKRDLGPAMSASLLTKVAWIRRFALKSRD